jgi:hypothetical protein
MSRRHVGAGHAAGACCSGIAQLPAPDLPQAQKLAEAIADTAAARREAGEAQARLPKLQQAVKHQEQVGGGAAPP